MRWCLLFSTVLLLAAPARGENRQGARALRNAVIVSIDSVRADHLSFYGYPRATTPYLEGLAARRGALVFERATAVSPACHPSHASLLLGLYPQQTGVPRCAEDVLADDPELAALAQDDAEASPAGDEPRPLPMARKKISAIANWLKIPAANEILPGFLAARGFRTGGFVSIWTIEGRFGYARGFERFSDDMPEYYGPACLAWLLRDGFRSQRRQVGEVTMDRALDYLAGLGEDERFFLFVHLADTHVPYAPRSAGAFPREDGKTRRALAEVWRSRYPAESYERAMEAMRQHDGFLLDRYDGAIRYADSQVARLMGYLERNGRLDDTLVVVLSDHGDSMGQHLYLSDSRSHRLFFEHSVYVWEETQHVPLIVFDPAVRQLTRRTANVSQVDVVPTVLARLGFDAADFARGELPGRDLTRLADEPRTVYFLTFGRGRPGVLKRSFQEFPKFIGLRSGDVKFFVDRERFKNAEKGRCFLYDLGSDPNELENLCGEAGAKAEAYRRLLVAWFDRSVAGRKESAAPR